MYHLHVRYRSRDGGTSCDAAREYIAREGRFKGRGDKVRWLKSLYMPTWAGVGSAAVYWRAAEGRHSRQNARTALLIEFAVPKELPAEQQDELAGEMVELLASTASKGDAGIRGKLPLTVAFHEGYGRNPHLHVLLSTSIADGFDRSPQSWFGRYNPQRPNMGGARRSKFVTERGWLFFVRQAWARLANAALARYGSSTRLDHRSYAARRLTTEPQLHLGPAVAHMHRLGSRTLRGERFDQIAKRRAEDAELEVVISRRRQEVQALRLEEISLDQAQRDWELARDNTLRQLLVSHPLAGCAAESPGQATAMVVESDRRDAEGSAGLQLPEVDLKRLRVRLDRRGCR